MGGYEARKYSSRISSEIHREKLLKGAMRMVNYTVEEAAQILKLKVRTVREMIHDGRIEAFKYPSGKMWIIPETEIKRLTNADKS